MAQHNTLGKIGEDIAAAFLTQKGYKILARNWRRGHEEIDIIAVDNKTLVIVEVKTRKTDAFGDPDLAVTKGKQRSLIRVAEAYIQQENLDIDTRFDIISIVLSKQGKQIEHIEDAFYPTL